MPSRSSTAVARASIGEHECLAVVAGLEKLLRAAVQESRLRVGGDDPIALDAAPQPQGTVARRVQVSEVEGDVGGCHARADGRLGHAGSMPEWRHGPGR
jgi:hypothetical protein